MQAFNVGMKMISIVEKRGNLWRLWGVLVAILLAVWGTLLLTRPAAVPMSMTPLSGLMTLKAMAADSMPYDSAITNQKPTLIEFYADWCTTCQSMSATMDKLQRQYCDQVNFVMLDIDNPQWAKQISEYGASGVPQFTLLSSAKEPLETWVGKVPTPIFNDAFDQAIGRISPT